MDPLRDPNDLLSLLASSPPRTFHVPEDAQIRLDDRHDGSHLLAGATITTWPEGDR